MRTVICNCESSFEADLPEAIDLEAEPRYLEEILSGSFFSVTCPSCGNLLKPELSVRISSDHLGLDVFVLPEIDRFSFLMGHSHVPSGAEVLIGYAELVERARVISDSLDPETVEILKYYLRLKAEDANPDGSDIAIAYGGKSDSGTGEGKLLFHISGLKKDEVAILPVSLDYYGRILAEKKKIMKGEPFPTVFKGPYRSIRVLESEAE